MHTLFQHRRFSPSKEQRLCFHSMEAGNAQTNEAPKEAGARAAEKLLNADGKMDKQELQKMVDDLKATTRDMAESNKNQLKTLRDWLSAQGTQAVQDYAQSKGLQSADQLTKQDRDAFVKGFAEKLHISAAGQGMSIDSLGSSVVLRVQERTAAEKQQHNKQAEQKQYNDAIAKYDGMPPEAKEAMKVIIKDLDRQTVYLLVIQNGDMPALQLQTAARVLGSLPDKAKIMQVITTDFGGRLSMFDPAKQGETQAIYNGLRKQAAGIVDRTNPQFTILSRKINLLNKLGLAQGQDARSEQQSRLTQNDLATPEDKEKMAKSFIDRVQGLPDGKSLTEMYNRQLPQMKAQFDGLLKQVPEGKLEAVGKVVLVLGNQQQFTEREMSTAIQETLGAKPTVDAKLRLRVDLAKKFLDAQGLKSDALQSYVDAASSQSTDMARNPNTQALASQAQTQNLSRFEQAQIRLMQSQAILNHPRASGLQKIGAMATMLYTQVEMFMNGKKQEYFQRPQAAAPEAPKAGEPGKEETKPETQLTKLKGEQQKLQKEVKDWTDYKTQLEARKAGEPKPNGEQMKQIEEGIAKATQKIKEKTTAIKSVEEMMKATEKSEAEVKGRKEEVGEMVKKLEEYKTKLVSEKKDVKDVDKAIESLNKLKGKESVSQEEFDKAKSEIKPVLDKQNAAQKKNEDEKKRGDNRDKATENMEKNSEYGKAAHIFALALAFNDISRIANVNKDVAITQLAADVPPSGVAGNVADQIVHYFQNDSGTWTSNAPNKTFGLEISHGGDLEENDGSNWFYDTDLISNFATKVKDSPEVAIQELMAIPDSGLNGTAKVRLAKIKQSLSKHMADLGIKKEG
ncbi:MAG: putative MAEBL [Candidatus Peregrinibacteria bacterium Greene0416_19]|nr:MAG: putative MAEBL [Candidatus Peregrinibacteria bacterium Greene0416_19]